VFFVAKPVLLHVYTGSSVKGHSFSDEMRLPSTASLIAATSFKSVLQPFVLVNIKQLLPVLLVLHKYTSSSYEFIGSCKDLLIRF